MNDRHDDEIDRGLLSRVLRSDQSGGRALELFYRREHPIVYRLCFGFLADPTDAEDAAQDALLRLHDALPGYDFARPWAAWRNTIVLNLCRDRLRRGATRSRAEAEVAIRNSKSVSRDVPDPSDSAASAEASRLLRDALALLSPREREVFVLRDLEDQDSATVAAALDITEGTVRSLLCLARRRLRDALAARLLGAEAETGRSGRGNRTHD